MTTFQDRTRSQEAKFALDDSKAFVLRARRNRLLGQWAGGLLGKTDAEAFVYGQRVVGMAVEGDQATIDALARDLAGKADADVIRAQMEACMRQVRAQEADDDGA